MPVKKQTKTKVNTEPILPFMIGSDPEFLMFFGARGLDASHIISGFFRNGGYRGGNNGFNIPNVGNFGWDGAASTAELRPVATKTVKEMVDNLHTMLKTVAEKIPTVDFTTLSIGAPIGGHIHVDDFIHTNQESYGPEPRNRAEKTRVENIMSTYLLPIAASDHRVSALNRLRGGSYGRLTDFRYERKGSVVTCEIRGLTAEWMTTPEIAYATFAYIVTVWHELKTRNADLAKQDFITRTKEQNETLQKMMLGDYKIIERGLCQSIRKSIKTFELYPVFKKHIDFILKPEEVMNVKASVGWNINTGWNLTKVKKPSKAALMSPKMAKEVLRKQNIPDIQEHFGISYNDDYNVSMFSAAIAERIAGLNWQLKHDYFLFGFKKAVDGYCAMWPDGRMFVMPTNQSVEVTKDTMLKMQKRIGNRNEARIDPKTGQIRKTDNSNKIIIGIPYEDRAAQNPKNLIKLIYEIENKKVTPKAHTEFAAAVTVNKEETFNLTDAIGSDPIRRDRYDVSAIISNQSTT
jgi:hypothetical protein